MQNFDKIIKAENNDAVLPIIQNDEYLPQHPFRMLINGSSGSGKTNLLLNLIWDKSSALLAFAINAAAFESAVAVTIEVNSAFAPFNLPVIFVEPSRPEIINLSTYY